MNSEAVEETGANWTVLQSKEVCGHIWVPLLLVLNVRVVVGPCMVVHAAPNPFRLAYVRCRFRKH